VTGFCEHGKEPSHSNRNPFSTEPLLSSQPMLCCMKHQWQAVVKTAMKVQVPNSAGNFLIDWLTSYQ